MSAAPSQPTADDIARRLNYFSRQCWHQRRLYDCHNTILRKRIEEQDAKLRDAHTRLLEAHGRLQEANSRLCELFAQLQDTTAARVVAELKLAGYGLLDRPTTVEVRPNVQRGQSTKLEPLAGDLSPFCSPPGFHVAWPDSVRGDEAGMEGGRV